MERDSAAFERLKRIITSHVGFDCAQYTNTFVGRRVDVRLRATSTLSYDRYADLLQGSESEREALLKELTIHVTHFFRDISMWSLFRDEVIPLLVKLRKDEGVRQLRVWSAGCSTGEEPLTIAICFLEALGERMDGMRIRIMGTDIDRETVERAKHARYEEIQFHEMPDGYKEKYFDRDERGLYVPKQRVLQLVEYSYDNILLPEKPKDMDIIFCRNTVIYFDRLTKERLYEEFFRALRPGGFLILGMTELLMGPARESFRLFSTHERIYCKE